MANLNFNANEVAPNSFECLPEGTYNAIIISSEWKPTRKGGGRYLELRLQIIDGQFKGRQLFDRLNLENPSAEAVRIARGNMSAICHAVGVLTPNDSCELHNLPLSVIVKCREYEGEMRNEIKGYKPKQAAAAIAQAAPANNSGPAPWSR